MIYNSCYDIKYKQIKSYISNMYKENIGIKLPTMVNMS